MSLFPWLSGAVDSEPYAVEQVHETGGDGAPKFRRVRLDTPQPAVNEGQGPAQIAPPLIPATAEQQKRSSSAAEQYGGAQPFNPAAADKSTIAVVALFLGGAWLYLRQK
jgi:hypothetical protein